MNTGYAELMKTKHVPFLVASSVMARMPLGSSVMLMVLLVDTHYGAAAAGTATALMTGAMAVCAPRYGQGADIDGCFGGNPSCLHHRHSVCHAMPVGFDGGPRFGAMRRRG